MSLSVIKTGGQQYVVTEGTRIVAKRINAQEGESVSFDTLLTSDEQGQHLEIGTPVLSKKVIGKVSRHQLEDKISVVKFRSKTRYRRRVGHRQATTTVVIEKM